MPNVAHSPRKMPSQKVQKENKRSNKVVESESDSEIHYTKKHCQDNSSSCQDGIGEILKKLNKLDTLEAKMNTISADIQSNNRYVCKLMTENKLLCEKVKSLEKSNQFLHCELNKHNILIHGVPESNAVAAETTASEFFKREFNLSPEIDIAYRIGAKQTDKIRPIKIKFVKLKERNLVWKVRQNLKKPYYMTEDLPLELRITKKLLNQAYYDAVQNGRQSKIDWKTSQVSIDDEIFEVLNGKLVPVEEQTLDMDCEENSAATSSQAFLDKRSRGRPLKNPQQPLKNRNNSR